MALDAELINLKSAGTYRFERDKSEISNDSATVSNLRLVVGFSKTGPFNTVKLVTSQAQFIKLYGNIDRSLEKKGSFFHRSALVALSAGPILCLNLLNLDPDSDQVIEKSFAVNSNDNNCDSITLPVQSLYNTANFWYANSESYLDAVNNCLGNITATGDNVDFSKKILHITNVGKKPVSVLIKKASDYSSKGYQLTLNEWYGEDNVPEYLNGTSYVSDYLVEVYVVGGDFGPSMTSKPVYSSLDLDGDSTDGNGDQLIQYTIGNNPYNRFSSDIVYQSYFNDKGFIRGENDANLTKFLNLPSVDLRAKYVGSLIPNFTDKLGRNIWIEKLINDDVDTVGLLCAENIDLLEDVNENDNFIEENIDIIGNNTYAKIVAGRKTDDNTIPESLDFNYLSYVFNYTNKDQIVKVGNDSYQNTSDAVKDKDVNKDVKHPFAWKKIKSNTTDTDTESSEQEVVEDEYVYGDSTYLKIDDILYTTSDGDNKVGKVSEIVEDTKPLMIEYKYKDASDVYVGVKGSRKKYEVKDNEVVLDKNANISVGDYVLSGYEHNDAEKTHRSRVTRVVTIKDVYDGDKESSSKIGILVSCSDKIDKTVLASDKAIAKIMPIDKIAENLQWIHLGGFQIRKDACPDGTNKRQNEILDMLRENPEYTSTVSNLYKTLTDRDFIQWRYLVDTFGLGLEEDCKSVYTKLCYGRRAGFAIVNCPSQMDFKKSLDPKFTNASGAVEAEFIANGGDRTKNPSFLFSLPSSSSIENGASWGAYYYPYLRITDLGAAKSVPPAAYVSNLYIQKYTRGFAWSIVAGQKRGVISGNQIVGVETTLVHDNRDWLEPVGINPIIWEPGVGVEVYANKTAKQTPVSALSSAHVREAAIYIQDGVESILKRYVFEFNTAQTRLEIKTLVDDFLNSMKNNGGLYDFKTVMDTSNNTSEIIDRNQAIIDIFVEIVRGLEIISQRLTILKTGAISAGGWNE